MAAAQRRRIIVTDPTLRSTVQPAVSGGIGRERQERAMQSQTVMLLAEVRHNEFQAEAARVRIVNQACGHGASPIGVAASALRRFRIALANAAARLHEQGVSAAASGNVRPAISGPGAGMLRGLPGPERRS
jgi:hypothetical protein